MNLKLLTLLFISHMAVSQQYYEPEIRTERFLECNRNCRKNNELEREVSKELDQPCENEDSVALRRRFLERRTMKRLENCKKSNYPRECQEDILAQFRPQEQNYLSCKA